MKKIITIYTLLLALFTVNNAFATTINVPADQPTIQAGINIAVEGDTVLVDTGRYVENINYNGKNIVLASLFLTTQDTSYISQTIIDGSQPSKPDSGSVVTFENGENNAVISGFTIKNGSNYGIYCYHCSPSITNNTIISNSDDGIYCYHYSSPTISYNTISGNSVRGIHCDLYSNPAVIENTISSNGRGIWCHYSSPTISNNIISNNSDGILCQNWSYPTISNNIISNNGNDGIWCAFSYPTINYNIISNNNSNGIYFCGCSPSITNTTISGNNTGIYCYKDYSHSCNPVIKNTIIWGNSSSFVFSGSNNPQISYCCIQGGFPSQGTNLGGNIYINPLFVGGGDYHLSWVNYPIPDSTKSPCIDAGDPNSPLEPDGTIADMGAYYYYQEDLISLPINITGAPACNIFIPLYYTNIFNIGIEGIEVTISYDNSILYGMGATLTGTVLENEDYGIQVNTISDSLLDIWIYANGDLFNGSGIISFLEFDVDYGAINGQTSELIFTQAEVNECPVTTYNGLFTVVGIYDISGTTNYFNGNDPVPNTRINLTGDNLFTTYTDSNGYFLFSDIPYGNYISAASKEDDLGGLSSMDASRIARYGVGLYDFNCYEIITADVTLNGYVSPTDASRVARYGVGLIDSLNDDGLDWVFVADSIESCANWPPIVYESTKEYTPLNSDLFDEDFVGIRLGDVTGNWTPSSLLRSEPLSKTVSAILPDTTVNQAVDILIPLTVYDLVELEGMDVVITFDEDVIDATGASLTEGILENQNFGYQINTTVDDEITLWIYAMQNLFTGSGVVCYLEFDVVGNVSDSTALTFTQFDVNEVNCLDNTTNGMLTISDQSVGNEYLIPDHIFLKQNFPNPVKRNATISYGLPKPCKIKIEIYNIKGQLVKILVDENKPAGYHSVEWNAEDMSSGIYFYKLTTEDKILIKKMILMR